MSDSRQARRVMAHIARRDLLHHWARTGVSMAVVIVAVALPLATSGSQSYQRVDDAKFIAAYWGHATVRVSSAIGSSPTFAEPMPGARGRHGPAPSLNQLLAEIHVPPGVATATVVTATQPVRSAGSAPVDTAVASVDFTSPVLSHAYRMVSGRLPRSPDEAVIVDGVNDQSSANRVIRRARVGSRLEGLAGRSVRLVGRVVMPSLYDSSGGSSTLRAELARGPGAAFDPSEVVESAVWVDEGASYRVPSVDDLEISRPNPIRMAAGIAEQGPRSPAVTGWLALAGIAIMATVVGASVRRRHRDLAQLAMAGAEPADLDRLAVTETRWMLLGGAGVGFGIGVAWSLVMGRVSVDPLVRDRTLTWIWAGAVATLLGTWIIQAAVMAPARSVFQRPVASLLRPASFSDGRHRHPWWLRLGIVVVIGLAAISFVSLALGHAIAGGLAAIQIAVFLVVFEVVCRAVLRLSRREIRWPALRLALSRTGASWSRARLALAGVAAVAAVLTVGQLHQGVAGRASATVSARDDGMPTSVTVSSDGVAKIERLADAGWDRFALGRSDVSVCGARLESRLCAPALVPVALSDRAVAALPRAVRAVLNAGFPMPALDPDPASTADLSTLRITTPSGVTQVPQSLLGGLHRLPPGWVRQWPSHLGRTTSYGVLVRVRDLARLGLADDANGTWLMQTDPRLDADTAAHRLATASAALGIGTVFEATSLDAWGGGGVRSDQLIGLGLALLVIVLLAFVDRGEREAERRVLVEQGATRGLLVRVAAAQSAVIVAAAVVVGGLGAMGILVVVRLLPVRSVVAVVGWSDLAGLALGLLVASTVLVALGTSLAEWGLRDPRGFCPPKRGARAPF